jgi:hypothetical protein
VYFTAQASHLSHLAAKLGAAVDEAMAISGSRQRQMMMEALSRRFPSDAMIAKYRDVWMQVCGCGMVLVLVRTGLQGLGQPRPGLPGTTHAITLLSALPPTATLQIDSCYCNSLRVRQRELAQLNTHAAYFAHKWAAVNKKGVSTPPPSATASGSHGGSGCVDGSSSPVKLQLQQQPRALPGSAAAAAGTGSAFGKYRVRGGMSGLTAVHGSASSLLELAHQAHDRHARCVERLDSGSSDGQNQQQKQKQLQQGGDGDDDQQRYWPKAQKVSNKLLVVMQYLGIGPGALLISFLLLQEVMTLRPGSCTEGLQAVQTAHWWSAGLDSLAARLIAFYGLSSVISPGWFFLAAYLRPVVYIRMAACLACISYMLAALAIFAYGVVNPVLLALAVTNLVACPLVSFGFLGDEEVEVSEVGRKMVALGDSTKYCLLFVAMIMAAVASSPLPHLAVTGFFMLVAAGLATWFLHPKTLSPAYQHLYLTYAGQWQQLTHLSCFWLTLVATVADSLGALLVGLLVVTVTDGLATFALVTAVGFGACAAAVLWNTTVLSSRAAELRLNSVVLMLAAMPFYQAFKGLVIILVPSAPVMVAVCGVLDLLMGARSSIMGLAGFMTLPSQEIVSIWQVTAISGLTAAIAVLVGAGMGATSAGVAASPWVLFGIICALEAVRAAVSCIGMPRIYPKENLSAP